MGTLACYFANAWYFLEEPGKLGWKLVIIVLRFLKHMLKAKISNNEHSSFGTYFLINLWDRWKKVHVPTQSHSYCLFILYQHFLCTYIQNLLLANLWNKTSGLGCFFFLGCFLSFFICYFYKAQSIVIIIRLKCIYSFISCSFILLFKKKIFIQVLSAIMWQEVCYVLVIIRTVYIQIW